MFTIDVSNDSQDTPTSLLPLLPNLPPILESRQEGGTLHVGRVFTWCEHTEPECKVRKKSPMTFASYINGYRSATISEISALDGGGSTTGRPRKNSTKDFASKLSHHLHSSQHHFLGLLYT